MKKIRTLCTVWNIKWCQQKWDILVVPHKLSLGGLLCVAHVNSVANVRCPASNTPKNMAITEQFSSHWNAMVVLTGRTVIMITESIIYTFGGACLDQHNPWFHSLQVLVTEYANIWVYSAQTMTIISPHTVMSHGQSLMYYTTLFLINYAIHTIKKEIKFYSVQSETTSDDKNYQCHHFIGANGSDFLPYGTATMSGNHRTTVMLKIWELKQSGATQRYWLYLYTRICQVGHSKSSHSHTCIWLNSVAT